MKTVMMQDWVDALRSGEFKQVRVAFKTTQGHCALGVGLELAGIVDEIQEEHEHGFISTNKIREALCLKGEEPYVIMILNDSDEWSFSAIADWIERHLMHKTEAPKQEELVNV